MWIRDSANQVAPYRSVLKSKDDDIASIFRGALNLQARFLIISPYCNAFLPPPEANMHTQPNGASYAVTPPVSNLGVVFSHFHRLSSMRDPSRAEICLGSLWRFQIPLHHAQNGSY